MSASQSPLHTNGIPHTHGVATADFDHDGLADVVTDSWGNDQLEVFFGDRKNLFETKGVFFKVGIRGLVNGTGNTFKIVPGLFDNTITLSERKNASFISCVTKTTVFFSDSQRFNN